MMVMVQQQSVSVLPSIPHIYSPGNSTHTTAHRAAAAASLPTCSIQQQQQAPHPTTSTPPAAPSAEDDGNTIQDDFDGVTRPME